MTNWTSASFAGNVLQSANILTGDIDHFSAPTIDAPLVKIAHSNKSAQPTYNWPIKNPILTGTIIDTTIQALDARIDTFKAWLAQPGNLDVDYNGSTRRYVCGVPDVQIKRSGGLLAADFTINFPALTFSQDVASTSLLNVTGRTANLYTDTVTFPGSAPFQLPVVTITLTSVTASGSQTISWGNAGTGQTISVTRPWAVNDVLVIDCSQYTVTVNGLAYDFSGAFPEFPAGSQSFTTTNQFSAVTFNEVVSVYALYM